MRSFAFLCAALAATVATAAPAPFVESSVAEATLETGNQLRTEAFLRWLTAADLAAQLTPGKAALPASFASKLKTSVQGGRVTLRIEGSARPDERALFKALLAKVSAHPAAAGDARHVAMQQEMNAEGVMINRKMILLGGGRGRRWGGEMIDMEQYQRQMFDQEIRGNPPRLVTKAR